MSGSNSTLSSDNSNNSGSTSAPTTGNQTDKHNDNTYDYFIPLLLMLVLGVIVVSTFYSEEFNRLVAAVITTDQADEPATDAGETVIAQTTTSTKAEDTAEFHITAETTSVNAVSSESTVATIETAATVSTHAMVDNSSNVTTTGQVLSPDYNNITFQHSPPYTGRQNLQAYPRIPPVSYDKPEAHQQAYIEVRQERRRSYEEAMRARREHFIRMNEYRAAVQKRIEQDRQDMVRHMQELQWENQRHRESLINRLKQEDIHSTNRPI